MLIVITNNDGTAELADSDTGDTVAEGQLIAMGGVPEAGDSTTSINLPVQFVGQAVGAATPPSDDQEASA
jgi:hypothetical protein